MNDACFSTFSTLLGCSGEDVVVVDDCARNATGGIFFARLNAALLFSIFPAFGGKVVVVVALPSGGGGKYFCWNAATIDLTGDGARSIVSSGVDVLLPGPKYLCNSFLLWGKVRYFRYRYKKSSFRLHSSMGKY
jgi:hypothetical protein|tara:strand:- start:3837 stop:4238 length:402 start_codon:yes stop_codon:yes gene_type:complete